MSEETEEARQFFASLILSYKCLTCQVPPGQRCKTVRGKATTFHGARIHEASTWAWEQKRKAHEAGVEKCIMCSGTGKTPKFDCECKASTAKKSEPHDPRLTRTCPHGRKFTLMWVPEDDED